MNCPNTNCEQHGVDIGSKKFCNKCGTATVEQTASEGAQYATKNVVGGDQHITATTIVNQDETAEVCVCSISGRQARRIEGYQCPSCGNWVHAEFYDTDSRKCQRCRDTGISDAEQSYKAAAVNAYADGVLTKEEIEELQHLGQQLGLRAERQKEILSELRQAKSSTKTLSAVDKAKLKTALVGLRDLRTDSKSAFVKRSQALATLRTLLVSYPADERIATFFVLGSAIQTVSGLGMAMMRELALRAKQSGELPSPIPDDIEMDSTRLEADQEAAMRFFTDARDVIQSSAAFQHDSAHNLLAQATFARAVSLFLSHSGETFGHVASMEEEEAESLREAAGALEAGFPQTPEWASLKVALALDEFYAVGETNESRVSLEEVVESIKPHLGDDGLHKSLAEICERCNASHLNFFSFRSPQHLSEEANLFFKLLYELNAKTIKGTGLLSHVWWLAGIDKHLDLLASLKPEEASRLVELPADQRKKALEKIALGDAAVVEQAEEQISEVVDDPPPADVGAEAEAASREVETLAAKTSIAGVNPFEQLPPASEELKKSLARSYFVMLLSLPTCGLGGVVAVVMAYLSRSKVESTWLASHAQWQIRTFWFSIVWLFVASLAGIAVFGEKVGPGPMPLLAWGWYYFRALKGRAALRKDEPAYSKSSPYSFMKATAAALVALGGAAFIGDKLKLDEKIETSGDDSQNVALSSSKLVEAEQRAQEAEAEIKRLQALAESSQTEAERLRAEAERSQQQAAAGVQSESSSYMQKAEELEKAGEWIQITSTPSFGTEVIDFDEAKSRADAGDAYAQAVVSIYYSTGYKTAKDTRQGLSYALQSAEQGHPLGAYRLGVILQEGEGGIPADPVEGVRLKARAVEGLNNMSGDPYAMTALGILLFRGEVLEKDQQMAAQLYKRAADIGYAPAQYTYSACLLFGRGVPKDQDLGMRYWRAAYDQGYSYALEGPPK